MNLLKELYKTVIDALFPLSKEEILIIGMSPEKAIHTLPVAPPYDSSVSPLANTRSVFAYKDPVVARLIWNIKYKKDTHSAEIGAFALHRELNRLRVTSAPRLSPVILVPMPSTSKRKRERGYNQCEFLLKHLKKLDKQNDYRIVENLLLRTRHTSNQKYKGRSDRLDSSKNIFAVDMSILKSPDGEIRSSPLYIVDDVITTGSTMKEALDTLIRAGFIDVGAISLAH